MRKFFKIIKILLIFFYIFTFLKSQVFIKAFSTFSNEKHTKKITPLEILVDTTNNLAYRILYHHSISNRNNFAFSPTSLISVVVALYEGSSGRSYLELQHFLEIPNNKDISRIGLRDIHRRLITYSFPQDNPLHGLNLNKDNITITPQYEAILKFYGYDLSFDISDTQLFIPETSTILPNENVPEILNISTESSSIEINLSLDDSTNNLTTKKTIINNNETEIIPATTRPTTTTTSDFEEMTTTPSSTIKETEIPELAAYSRPKTSITSDKIKKKNDVWPTFFNITAQKLETFSSPSNNKQKSNISNSRNKKINNPIRSIRNKRFLGNILTHSFYTPYALANFKQLNRNILINSNGETLLNNNPTNSFYSFSNPYIKNINDGNFGVEFDSQFIFPKETSLKNTINHIFYLNNHETIQTNYKTYNSILNFKYFMAQKITVLELELNSIEYSLMIFLPDFNIDIDAAVSYLKYIPSLRSLRKQMKPKWVQAIIPDLKLRGKIYLTNDLQNMGVKDIFEPSRADLSSMTNENDIYVKHIEQIVDVRIRTKPIDQIKGIIAQQIQPIEVAVNHPFIFFVIDKEIDVAILAGRAINPLNLRIQ